MTQKLSSITRLMTSSPQFVYLLPNPESNRNLFSANARQKRFVSQNVFVVKIAEKLTKIFKTSGN